MSKNIGCETLLLSSEIFSDFIFAAINIEH